MSDEMVSNKLIIIIKKNKKNMYFNNIFSVIKLEPKPKLKYTEKLYF